jgi:hypothetical protein
MDPVQLYRNRATHLWELAFAERDVTVRQQLHRAALGFDQFADEVESAPVKAPVVVALGVRPASHTRPPDEDSCP